MELDRPVREIFSAVREDYLADPFKYLSETDVVFEYGYRLHKSLADTGYTIHFEVRPRPGMGRVDLVVLLGEPTNPSLAAVLEFKIRVRGNRERMIKDLRDTDRLSREGVVSYLLVFDRCAPASLVEQLVDEALPSHSSQKERVLVVSDKDSRMPEQRPKLAPPDELKDVVVARAMAVLRGMENSRVHILSEADLVFAGHRRLLENPDLAGWLSAGQIDLHFELRPFLGGNGREDRVILEGKGAGGFGWSAQRVKNEGVRFDLALTTRDSRSLACAYSKAVSDQKGKMGYWRILSHPVENILLAVEFKKGVPSRKDQEKIRCLRQERSQVVALVMGLSRQGAVVCEGIEV
jgi:hypothetical protein